MTSARNTSRRASGRASGVATLRQVAERAGVHPGTASRALQGDKRVAPATLQHIQRIASELNYTPNVAARVLALGKTQTIAIATGSVNEHYYARILHFLEEELTASHYKRLLLSSRDIKGDLRSIVNTNAVDGVIAIDSFPKADDLRPSADAPLLPCVYAGVANAQWTHKSDVDIVEVDLSGAVRQAIQIMLHSGCQRVAYIATDNYMSSADEVRARVYTSVLQAANRPREVINLELEHTNVLDGLARDVLTRYLKQYGCPDGLLCQNDEVAMLAASVVAERGLRVPGDVQLVGCDGLPYLECFTPPISTIVQPASEMCALAWKFLQHRLNNPALPRQAITLEAHLRLRPSLKIPHES